MKYKKVLVTGSSAVLGSSFKKIAEKYSGTEFVFLNSEDCDLTNSRATLDLVSSQKPNAIIHLAAVSGGIGLSIKHPVCVLRDNVLMTFSILDAAKACRIEKTIMTLTTGMYPPDAPLPLNEDTIHDGYPHGTNYGSSFAKRLIDPAIRAYREEYGLNVIGLVPNGIFGEHDNFNYDDAPMLPSLIRRFYENKNNDNEITIWGNGKPLREYTYSRDLAEIYMWALEKYDASQVLNIGTTEENSVQDIAHMIADSMKISHERIVFDTTKPNGVFRKNTDNSRFQDLYKYQYTPFQIGLEKTIQWFCQMYENNPQKIRMYGKAKSF